MKFGGTSLEDAPAITRAADLVEAAAGRRPAVVVSAAAGVTDTLETLLVTARDRGNSASILTSLRERHHTIVTALEIDGARVAALLGEVEELVHGIALLAEVTSRTRDLVLSYGEQILAAIFAAHLTHRGMAARAWRAGELGLVTDDRYTRARPLPETYERIPATLRAEPSDHIPVVTGFMGKTRAGQRTTLGRGGSDYTASIVARALGAEEVQIWTDVPGILTADPRLVPAARLIPNLTFREASELAFSGAKVLHPSTITPAMEGVIPVRVLDTRNPDQPGTLILGERGPEEPPVVRSIAHKSGVRVVTIVSPRMLARHGFISRIAGVFDRHGVSIDMISTSEVSVSMTTDDPLDPADAVIQELQAFSEVRLDVARGMVSVVGGGLGDANSAVGEVFRVVADTEAQVEMISYGATRTNLSFIIDEKHIPDVVRALHRYYFESRD